MHHHGPGRRKGNMDRGMNEKRGDEERAEESDAGERNAWGHGTTSEKRIAR